MSDVLIRSLKSIEHDLHGRPCLVRASRIVADWVKQGKGQGGTNHQIFQHGLPTLPLSPPNASLERGHLWEAMSLITLT